MSGAGGGVGNARRVRGMCTTCGAVSRFDVQLPVIPTAAAAAPTLLWSLLLHQAMRRVAGEPWWRLSLL